MKKLTCIDKINKNTENSILQLPLSILFINIIEAILIPNTTPKSIPKKLQIVKLRVLNQMYFNRILSDHSTRLIYNLVPVHILKCPT